MRHLLFICLLLFCVACEENESVDPTIMPEATTTGANTFGCLVDGWVYTSGRWGMPSAEYLEREEGSSVTVSAQVGLGSYIRFTIADPKEGETLPYVNLSFENQNMEDGKVYISRIIIRKTKNSSFKNEKSKKEVDVAITVSNKDIV